MENESWLSGLQRNVLPLVALMSLPFFAFSDEPGNSFPTLRNSIGMTLVELPAGKFLRGASPADKDATEDEFPVAEIQFRDPFWIGRYEVTQQEFHQVMGENPAWFSSTGPARGIVRDVDTSRWPLDNASWKDATEFCRRLTALPAEQQARRTYRLPTEAEWEYACRAGTETPFYCGNELSHDIAWFGQTGPRSHPLPVGSFPPNSWGLCDMHGNVWEWCAERYSPDSYSVASPSGTIKELPGSTARVVRGGDWRSSAAFCRSSNRDLTRESRRDIGNGFRIICEIRN